MLDAEHFLDRVIAPGNYLAIAFKGQRGGMVHRFFPRSHTGAAAGFIRWATRKGMDCWYAVASYKDAELKENERYLGARTQANVEQLRCFWYDADVKRDGDGKDPSRVYSDQSAAIAALAPLKAAGFPLPNLWVRSGYGIHFYWILEDALDRDAWTPYAEAFKQVLIKHGLKGDVGLTSDSARILRPVEGKNFKDPANPMDCDDITPASLGALLPNSTFLQLLQPTTVGSLTGVAPAVPIKRTMLANARAGLDQQPYPKSSFARVAERCAQVRQSLAEGGANDERELWHHLVGLAYFCDDKPMAHAIGAQHPTKYSPADTEAEWDQWVSDHQKKPALGATGCERFNTERKGICDTCPHRGKISTPWWLGVDPVAQAATGNPDDLPFGYQRRNGWIEHTRKVAKDEYEWARLIEGDMTEVGISAAGPKKCLHFKYTCGKRVSVVQVDEADISNDPNHLKKMFANRGITLNFDNPVPFGKLLMAWIEKLQHSAHREAVPSIGWAKHSGEYVGFSVGGVCYRADGTEAPAPSDAEAENDRKPTGKLEMWQEAAQLALGNPVSEIAVAIGFAAPLMEFTGEDGLCVAVMGKSATGKTSAFKAGQAIWSRPKPTMFSADDTENYVHIRVGKSRNLPAYWDENILTKDRAARVVGFIHKITQGRDKGRAMADASVRQSGEWNTLVGMSSNQSILDLVSGESNETNAAALRVFELNINRIMPQIINANITIAELNDNYGTAGAKYAKFISANVPGIRILLGELKDHLIVKTGGIRSDERFYVAGMCSILAGAIIAAQLELLDFDLTAIRDELVSTLLRLRSEREDTLPINNDRVLITEAINEFCNAHQPDSVVTKYLKPAGKHDIERGFEVSAQTNIHKLSTPAYQIALLEKLLRIDRTHWRNWCGSTHRNSKQLIKLSVDHLGAKPQERGTIGAGAHFSTPTARYIEIPLTAPELNPLVVAYLPAAAAAGTTNVLPIRPVR